MDARVASVGLVALLAGGSGSVGGDTPEQQEPVAELTPDRPTEVEPVWRPTLAGASPDWSLESNFEFGSLGWSVGSAGWSQLSATRTAFRSSATLSEWLR